MNEQEKTALRYLLDYVERWNKKDEDIEAANAARELEGFLAETEGKKGCCEKCRGEDIVEGGCISPKFCPCHLEGKPEGV